MTFKVGDKVVSRSGYMISHDKNGEVRDPIHSPLDGPVTIVELTETGFKYVYGRQIWLGSRVGTVEANAVCETFMPEYWKLVE